MAIDAKNPGRAVVAIDIPATDEVVGGWPRFMVDYGDAILGNVKKRRGVRALAFFDVRVWR